MGLKGAARHPCAPLKKRPLLSLTLQGPEKAQKPASAVWVQERVTHAVLTLGM